MQNREKVQRHNAHTLLPSPSSPLAYFNVTVGSVNSKKHHRSKEVKKKKRRALHELRKNKCCLTEIKSIAECCHATACLPNNKRM